MRTTHTNTNWNEINYEIKNIYQASRFTKDVTNYFSNEEFKKILRAKMKSRHLNQADEWHNENCFDRFGKAQKRKYYYISYIVTFSFNYCNCISAVNVICMVSIADVLT